MTLSFTLSFILSFILSYHTLISHSHFTLSYHTLVHSLISLSHSHYHSHSHFTLSFSHSRSHSLSRLLANVIFSTFIADIARALSLQDPSRVNVLSLSAGSIIVEFSITAPVGDASALIALQLQALLERQLANPASVLMTGVVTSLVRARRLGI